jgi:hypothetical protein
MKGELQRQLRTGSPIYGRVFAPMIVNSPAQHIAAAAYGAVPDNRHVERR